jgi:hypothetical protein
MKSDDDPVRSPESGPIETTVPTSVQHAKQADPPYTSTLSGLVRLSWVLFLPVAILGHLGWLLANDVGATDLPSLTFWLAVLFLVVARFVDVAYFRGETSEGGRATMGDVRRFALTAVGLCGAAWMAIHLT